MSFTLAIQNENGYSFAPFETYTDFKRFHLSVEDSSHYEVIKEAQCLYFDFDGEFNAEPLVEAIKVLCGKIPIRIDLYSSCDNIKKSYHVLVKGIYFEDHIKCGHFAKNVIKLAPMQSFDSSVYTSKRNFRLLGSRKLNSTRIKIFSGTLFKSPDYSCRMENDALYMSLVIGTIDCRLMDVEIEERSRFTNNAVLQQSDKSIAMELINRLCPGIFEFREIRETSIFLTRKVSGMCPVCSRIHQNENAVISKRNNGFHFMCLRDTSQTITLEDDEEYELPVVQSKVESEENRRQIFAKSLVKRFGFH
jgi:hypothetical protein